MRLWSCFISFVLHLERLSGFIHPEDGGEYLTLFWSNIPIKTLMIEISVVKHHYKCHSFTVHLDIITFLFVQQNAQLDCSRKMLKLSLKVTLKCSYMFRFNNHHHGSYCCDLLKL